MHIRLVASKNTSDFRCLSIAFDTCLFSKSVREPHLLAILYCLTPFWIELAGNFYAFPLYQGKLRTAVASSFLGGIGLEMYATNAEAALSLQLEPPLVQLPADRQKAFPNAD
jgi:hypothetical protein